MNVPDTERIYVSALFRGHLVDRYPGAFDDPSLARLLQELLFPRWRDKDTGSVVLSQGRLGALEGREDLLRQHRYSGEAFLNRFQDQAGLGLEVQEARWWEGRARTAVPQWEEGLEGLLSAETRILPHERDGDLKLVDFLTGKPASPRSLERQRTLRRKERKAIVDTDDVRLLNQTPSNMFARFTHFFDQAQEVADSIEADSRRHSNLRTLFALAQIGLDPTYKSAERTPRIYTQGISTSQLSANVRATLLGESWHLDLTAAQLAILAKLWGLSNWNQLLDATLQRGQVATQVDVWGPLLAAVGLENPQHKKAFKRLVYATAYGMSTRNLQAQAEEDFKEKATALFRTTLMEELMDGRAERQRQLQREGALVDVFGKTVTLDERVVSLRERSAAKGSDAAVRSLMAHEAQAYELYLMQPVFDLLRASKRFQVALWLHDGCYVTTTRHPEAVQIRKLAGRVNARAAQAGMATFLSYEQV